MYVPRPIVCAGLALALALAGAPARAAEAAPVQVGSKRFTESYVLGAIVQDTFERAGVAAVHRPGLGNTAVLEQALASGAIDVYPEYTGTILRELLHDARDNDASLARLNERLAPRGLKVAIPLGFANGYALAMREAQAARLGIATISDLAAKPAARELRLGLSHEFLGRADGWPGLRRAYGLPWAAPPGLDHGLAYAALDHGEVDVIDVYTTDARLARGGVRLLRDDLGFFPAYEAVLLMRAGLDAAPLQVLAGRIDEATMRRLNAAVEIQGRPCADVAREFVASFGSGGDPHSEGGATQADASGAAVATQPAATPWRRFVQRLVADDLWRLTRQHLLLVFGSLALALLLGVPLGVLAWRRPALGQVVLAAVALLQTVPSLALLAFLIAIVGRIGFVPALLALWLYALLPIVRNTLVGLQGVGSGMSQAAQALGLTAAQRLRFIELPIALPTLLAGAQTAAVINVGTATMAAFIGAGGYGERIVAGLALDDTAVLLSGAVPAAVLALLVQGGFEWLMRAVRRT